MKMKIEVFSEAKSGEYFITVVSLLLIRQTKRSELWELYGTHFTWFEWCWPFPSPYSCKHTTLVIQSTSLPYPLEIGSGKADEPNPEPSLELLQEGARKRSTLFAAVTGHEDKRSLELCFSNSGPLFSHYLVMGFGRD